MLRYLRCLSYSLCHKSKRNIFPRKCLLVLKLNSHLNKIMVLEVCVDSIKSAISALNGGANRLELCSSLMLGGLTPSLGFFKTVKNLGPSKCKTFVMIRTKSGDDYIYDKHDLDVMVEDIKIFKQNGADGFVFGCLNDKKEVDEEACLILLEAASDSPCTFHRAFDFVNDPEQSLRTIINLGFSRVLTSGQEKTAYLGRHFIKKLISVVKQLNSDLIIVPGGGIDPSNLKDILITTGAKEYHGSARKKTLPNHEENNYWVTSESVVRELIVIGKTCSEKS